jgi:hypothetical protein
MPRDIDTIVNLVASIVASYLRGDTDLTQVALNLPEMQKTARANMKVLIEGLQTWAPQSCVTTRRPILQCSTLCAVEDFCALIRCLLHKCTLKPLSSFYPACAGPTERLVWDILREEPVDLASANAS